MSRGRYSQKAHDAAMPFARARGVVIPLPHIPGASCDFLIFCPTGVIAVSIRRTRRIHAGIPEIARTYKEPLEKLHAVLAPCVTAEFWLWAPNGTMRFFRYDGAFLTGIEWTGNPLAQPVSRTVNQPAGAAGKPVRTGTVAMGNAGIPINQERILLEKNPGQTLPAPDSQSPPGRQGVHDPPHVRFLRLRARDIERLKASGSGEQPGGEKAGPVIPEKGEGVSLG